MTLARLAATAILAVPALALAACDSAAENQTEDVAEAIDESYEAEADMVEAVEEGGPNEEVAEQQADVIRAEGEQIKDDLEDAADELDATPQ
ncbi:hypothetical protein [Alteraurantiacibacter buctensis]|uniref:Uncharacterized protein n=1 Tax=Alteraurantiacibacter buctensis TaxID=1503981 RepID=A0A844Z0G1_9SPHN|nr:hypothetical protein [Alteraurantiacibacter buctensis]MXO72640.1 hypothetical protein [Alteraurantiacibacter buctensis]